ncbi:MAG: hypothetical protein RJA99_2385 [Pseudomonadota bacterium]
MNRHAAETRDAPSAFAESRSPARLTERSERTERTVRGTLRRTPSRDPATAPDRGLGRARASGSPTAAASGPASLSDLVHRPLIVHAPVRWDGVRRRPQQLFSRLAADHPVLFVEDPVHEAVDASTLRVSEPQRNLVRVVPVLPESHARDTDLECASVAPLLRAALASHPLMARRFDRAIQWFCSPLTAPVYLGQFGTGDVVYDCMDEPAEDRSAPADLAGRERHLLERAKLVFTGSPQRVDATSPPQRHVQPLGCGIDAAHYARARDAATEVPRELATLPGPVLGHLGEIDRRIDFALLARLAEAFPQGSIVLVGPFAGVDPASLPRASNLHWLGPRDDAQQPALLKGFDVCLMPFGPDASTACVDPAKTLEYMAARKPIVSTAVPEVMRRFVPIVEVAHDHEAFVDAVERAVAAPCHALLAKGVERAQRASWEAIAAAMRGHLLDAFRPARTQALPAGFVGASSLALGGA